MSMNYEPMTGEPAEQNFDDMGWNPITGQPDTGMFSYEPAYQTSVGKPRKSPKKLIVIALVLAIALIVSAGVFAAVYFEKGNVVLRAVANTLNDENHLTENASIMTDIINSGKYTIDVKGETEGQEFSVKIQDIITEKQIKGTMDVENLEVDFNLYLDEEQLAVHIPVISDKVFTYNYMAGEENNGYLMQYMDQDAIESFNAALGAYTKPGEMEEEAEDIQNVLLDEYKTLEFEKVENGEFEVDGAVRKCKGYGTTITASDVVNVLNAYDQLLGLQEIGTEEVDVAAAFSELRDMASEMPDVKTTFYLYENKLAAITLDTPEQSIEIAFLGGDSRTQNMKVTAADQVIMEVKGTTDGSVEDSRIYVMDQEIYSLQYNYEAGNYTLDVPSLLYAEGSLTSEKNAVLFTITNMEMQGEAIDLTLEYSVAKGAAPVKIGGTAFNVGTASAADFSRLGKEISDFYQKIYREVYLK